MDDGGSDHGLEFLLAFDGRIHHLEKLLDDFFEEVERVLRDRGIGLQVTRTETSRGSK